MLHFDLSCENQPMRRYCLSLPLELGRGHEIFLARSWLLARRHACVFRRASGLFIKDYGSLLGTRLNGHRVVSEQALCVNDLVQIGPYSLRIVADNFACPPPPELLNNRSSSTEGPHDSAVKAPVGIQNETSCVAHDELPGQALWLTQSRLHQLLLSRLDLARRDLSQLSDKALYQEAYELLGDILAEETLFSPAERLYLQKAVCDEALGLGALESLLANEMITEIMVNRYDTIYIESAGRVALSTTRFSSESALRAVLDRILAPLGRRLDEQSPLVDARLRDGSRVHAVISPIALQGCSVTIRKFPRVRLAMKDWVEAECLSTEMALFLRACMQARVNVLLSGGTGTGKTSLLNALSAWIPEHERLISIEDAAELRLVHGNKVSLEARPANSEGQGLISIRELVRNALRMRPDRIIIGECRGAEAFDMLAAMNTGHEGSLSTLHANGPRDALARLETMVLTAGLGLPLTAVREHIGAALQCLVQLSRLPCGKRVVSEIVEVTGMESGRIQTQSIYQYHPGPPAAFVATGLRIEFPRLRDQLAQLKQDQLESMP